MRLTWYIAKKDLRHLRPWLALLGGIILVRYLSALTLDLQLYGTLGSLLRMDRDVPQAIDWSLQGLALLCTALIAATLVHNDPVTGDNNFWVTRPISGRRLLAAKSLTLCLTLVALPLALQLLWWLLHGYRAVDLHAQFPSSLLPYAGIAFAAFFFALLTRGLGGFLLTVLISGLGGYVTLAVLSRIFPLPSAPLEDLVSKILQNGIIIAAAFISIAVQYYTRRTRLTLGISLLLTPVGIGVGVVSFLPRSPAFEQYPKLTSAPAIDAHVATTTPARDENLGAWTGERYEHGHILDVAISLKNISGDSSVHLHEIVSSTLPLEAKSFLKNYYVLPGPPSRDIREQIVHVALSDSQNPRSTPTLTQPHDATLHFLQRRLQIVARLPLRDRASSRFGPYTTEIVQCLYVGRRIEVGPGAAVILRSRPQHALIVNEIAPSQLIDAGAKFPEIAGSTFREQSDPHATYYLTSARETIPATKHSARRILSIDGVERWSVDLDFPVELTDASLAGYELVKVIAPVVGTFERTITIPPSVPGTPVPQSAATP